MSTERQISRGTLRSCSSSAVALVIPPELAACCSWWLAALAIALCPCPSSVPCLLLLCHRCTFLHALTVMQPRCGSPHCNRLSTSSLSFLLERHGHAASSGLPAQVLWHPLKAPCWRPGSPSFQSQWGSAPLSQSPPAVPAPPAVARWGSAGWRGAGTWWCGCGLGGGGSLCVSALLLRSSSPLSSPQHTVPPNGPANLPASQAATHSYSSATPSSLALGTTMFSRKKA